MLTLEKAITIEAPIKEVFAYLEKPANLPQIWPSLFEVRDVKTLPQGGHSFAWYYNLAGKKVQGTTQTFEYVPGQRIVDKTVGDIESTFSWTLYRENGTTKVKFEFEYELPERFVPFSEKTFVMRRNEFEAETLLSNLKAKLEV
jgi:uncharacterized membrane protein